MTEQTRIRKFKKAAAEAGFNFWYDGQIRLWSLSKEGYTSEHISTFQFREHSPEWLIKNYITNATRR
jgi:hypothetical protein